MITFKFVHEKKKQQANSLCDYKHHAEENYLENTVL